MVEEDKKNPVNDVDQLKIQKTAAKQKYKALRRRKSNKGTLLGKVFVKKNYPVKAKKSLHSATRSFFAIFMCLAVLVGVGRVGYYAVLDPDNYRMKAEKTAYQENEEIAQRGTIYASDNRVLASSYFVWDLGVDPAALNERTSNNVRPKTYAKATGRGNIKDDETIEKITGELTEKYINALAGVLNFVLNDGVKKSSDDYLTTEEIYSILTAEGEPDENGKIQLAQFKYIKHSITAAQKMQLEKIVDDYYYNYYFDEFYAAGYSPSEEEEAEIEIVEDSRTEAERAKDSLPSTYKKYYFYDYANDKYTCRILKTTDSSVKFICSEFSSLEFEIHAMRRYADDGLCSTVLGFMSGDTAIGGVEAYYDSTLAGTNGLESGLAVYYNGSMAYNSDSDYNAVQDGNNLVLTIDSGIQSVLEESLKNAYNEYEADETFGILMDVNTGAVLAMSDYPNYDTNNPSDITAEETAMEKALSEIQLSSSLTKKYEALETEEEKTAMVQEQARNNQWSNFCINYPYELGSTFKLFTASAALEEGIIDTDTQFHTCTGSYEYAKNETIACSHNAAHGTESMAYALAVSCNTFFVHLGITMGKDTFNKYFKAFGLAEKTGIDLSGETVGSNRADSTMTLPELASTAFGQTATITAIQLITGVCAIANGGYLLKPYIVDRVTDTEGNIVSKTETTVRRQVITEETCEKVTEMMKGVVYNSYGTANTYINIAGYTIAGKTGSGEIQGAGASNGENGYKYTASFVGFAPADDPQIAIVIGIRNPEGGYLSGGQIAAPVASDVLGYALSDLEISSTEDVSETAKTVPDFSGNTVETAKLKASQLDYTYVFCGEGDTVVSQNPAKDEGMPESGVIAFFTDDESYTAEVPDFTGMTKSEALSAARKAGINISLNDCNSESDKVKSQSEGAGETIKPGNTVRVYFSAD